MYIALEGIDTCGKSTQIDILKKSIKKQKNKKYIFTCEPGSSKLGKKLRDILLNHKIQSKTSEFFLFLSDRAEHIKRLKPLLKDKQNIIVSDRSLVSGVAYCKAFNFKQSIKLNLLATDNIIPDKVIILKLSKKELKKRLRKKSKDAIEQRGIDYLLKIQNKTIKCVKKLNIKHKIINASLSKESIAKKIKDFINER